MINTSGRPKENNPAQGTNDKMSQNYYIPTNRLIDRADFSQVRYSQSEAKL